MVEMKDWRWLGRTAASAGNVPAEMIARLIPRYAEPHRHYHTWGHVTHVFDACEQISSDRSLPLALAIYYHDAVYDPLGGDNEAASARLCVSEGRRAGLPENILEEAAAIILSTRHAAEGVPVSERARIMLDADLAIFGADAGTFDTYEQDVREEYAMVPDEDFASGRKKVLQSFLDRKTIYWTEVAQRLWENKARSNLARSITKLLLSGSFREMHRD